MATKDTRETGGPATAEQEQGSALAPANTPTETGIQRAQAPAEAFAKVPVRMGLAPASLEEAWRMASFMAKSELVPKSYQGKPNDILVGIQYGMELGFAPMQSLQSIAVINGRPSVWGDGFLALIMCSPLYQDHEEYFEVDGKRVDAITPEDLKKDTTRAVCVFHRAGKSTPNRRDFSVGKAKTAGLWGKQGPWQNYPDVMLTMRARSFCGRATFPDLLRGIRTAEEAFDTPTEIVGEPEPAKEVRRLSETQPAADASTPAAATPVHAKPADASNDVTIGPVGVLNVEQFMGGFTVTLSNGQKIDTIEAAEALDLEKLKGTKYSVRAVCTQAADGNLQLKSFAIAD